MIEYKIEDVRALYNALRTGGKALELIPGHHFKDTGLHVRLCTHSNGNYFALHGDIEFKRVREIEGFRQSDKPVFGLSEKKSVGLEKLIEAYSKDSGLRSEGYSFDYRRTNIKGELLITDPNGEITIITIHNLGDMKSTVEEATSISVRGGDIHENRFVRELDKRPKLEKQINAYLRILGDFTNYVYSHNEIKPPDETVLVAPPKIRMDTSGDLQQVYLQVHPAVPRDISFKSVGGLTKAKEYFGFVIDYFTSQERYKKWGAQIPKGVLLHGPPGNGKTLFAKALANEAGVDFWHIKLGDFVSGYYGDPVKKLQEILKLIEDHGSGIIFFDEFEQLGRHRAYSHEATSQLVGTLLTYLDGFEPRESIILAATNLPEIIDKALLRPGRIERRFEIGNPNREEREEIFRIHTNALESRIDRKVYGVLDYRAIGKALRELNGSQIAYVVNLTSLETARSEKEGRNATQITTADFLRVIESYRKELREHGELWSFKKPLKRVRRRLERIFT